MKYFHKTFEFLNDWRDSFFYGILGVFFIALHIGGVSVEGSLFFLATFVWIREFFRDFSWHYLSFNESLIKRFLYQGIASTIYISVNILQLFDLTITEKFNDFTIFMLAAMSFIFFVNLAQMKMVRLSWMGLICGIPVVYWQNMFDWPRKQKPPTHRIKNAKEAISKLMQKIADAAMPGALPAGARMEKNVI